MRALVCSVSIAAAAVALGVSLGFDRGARLRAGEAPSSATAIAGNRPARVVSACDRRKTVVVEGVRPDEPMAPGKARRVAALLQDLMRFCDQEVTARVTTREEIFLSVNGAPYQRYLAQGRAPFIPVHGGRPHGQREQRIWKAEYERVVKQGDKLFHDPSLGTNGISCDMCHPDAANTHPETYPKFQTQLKRVALLRDMINWCIENPLEGPKLTEDSAEMKAIEAYILAQRKGAPIEPGKH
jgi:thiosulfate dehydrogenase